jgi:hypothetical protein
MNATKIIRLVEQQGATIKLHGDVLEVVNGQSLPPETVNLLKQHKPDLLAHLAAGKVQQIIEPLDHHNDSPQLTHEMVRALNGLDYLMNQKRSSLRKNDYPESNAMVSREEWRTVVIRVLHIHWQAMDVLEDRLYRLGALGYQQGRIYVVRGDGEPNTRNACMKNPDFILDDDTGRTFTNWLYS